MRNRELSADDLEAILYWYTKAFSNSSPKQIDQHKNTLIKIQALAIYAQEEEERFDSLFKRRFK